MLVGHRRALAVFLMAMVVRSTAFLQYTGSLVSRRAVALNAAKFHSPTQDGAERLSCGDATKRRGTGSGMMPHLITMVARSTFVQNPRPFFTRTAVALNAAKVDGLRPTLDDVERLSRGEAAKRRGTGSRAVPHRLNQLERKEWDLSKRRRYLLLRGTGYRKERGASPLANIYRQLCDALNIVCISVARGVGSPPLDEVVIDFSPLRTTQVAEMARVCMNEAASYSSFQGLEDRTDVDALGYPDLDVILKEDVIWRIPVFSVSATFASRADSRKYAETIAVKFANGVIPTATTDDLEEDE